MSTLWLCKCFEQRQAELISSFMNVFAKATRLLRTVDVDVCVDVELRRLECALVLQDQDIFLSAIGALVKTVDISNIGGPEYFELLYKLFYELYMSGWSLSAESFERAIGVTVILVGNKYDLYNRGELEGASEVPAREYYDVDLGAWVMDLC
ncbi:hypothetical protein M758_10G103100 [Ceratodon purpureus]|nr:hypothetical protein M758_10G103100 [Ceratodon purpureus]